MRPLWWEFPADTGSYDVDDQYLLGPELLVAPVTTQNATTPRYFPAGAKWQSFWDHRFVVDGGKRVVDAPVFDPSTGASEHPIGALSRHVERIVQPD